MMSQIDSLIPLCKEIFIETVDLIKLYNLGFYDNFRSNPLINITEYLYNTVNYGKYLNNKNCLLFGGELDLINNTIYDIIATSCLWRYFNLLNDLELKKLQQLYPNDNISLNHNFGIRYVIDYDQPNLKFYKYFDTLSSPNVLKTFYDKLLQFKDLGFVDTLYNRLKLFGFIDYIDNDIVDNHINELIEESISKQQIVIYNISQYSSGDCLQLYSIIDYFNYIKSNPVKASLKLFYEEIIDLISDESKLKQKLFSKYHDVLKYSLINGYPILYLTKI